MPELPEVETVRRGLVPKLVGRRIVRLIQRRRDLRVPLPAKFAKRVEGRTVLAIDRRAKYLLLRLDDGNTLIAHLGMSGRMTLHDAKSAAEHPFERHDHVVFETDEGWQVRFNDARRFGLMLLAADEAVPKHKLFKGLGPEPLDETFDGAALASRLKGRKTPIKAALLDQKTLVGVGNIYACEALFLAGISPRRSAHTVQGERADRLVATIKQVLLRSIDDGGSTLRDHVQPGGELGYFQTRFNVYDRAGAPCPTRDLRQDRQTPGAVGPLDLLLRALPALANTVRALEDNVTAYQNIKTETKGRVGIIRLDRPKALNALCADLVRELGQALDAFEADPGIGCMVLTGSDKAFAAGADIKEMKDQSYQDVFLKDFITVGWEKVSQVRKPIVAAVAGYALGGGCEMAMMCDFIIAADNAKFGQPEITLGTIPGAGGTQRLPRFVGKSKAMDLVLTGRMMDAAEAERCGLVSRVVPLADLMNDAIATAEKIAGMSLPATMVAKEAVNRAFETTLAEGVRFERRTFHATFAFEDRAEGMAAFADKRKPAWKHR